MSDQTVDQPGQESPEEKSNKVAKAFEQNVAKLSAILKGAPSKTGRKKVPTSDVDNLVSELFAEENEQLRAEVKEEIKALLKKYVEYNKAKKAKEEELVKVDQDQMKAFSEAAQKLFNKIEGIPVLEQQYAAALKQAGQQTT